MKLKEIKNGDKIKIGNSPAIFTCKLIENRYCNKHLDFIGKEPLLMKVKLYGKCGIVMFLFNSLTEVEKVRG